MAKHLLLMMGVVAENLGFDPMWNCDASHPCRPGPFAIPGRNLCKSLLNIGTRKTIRRAMQSQRENQPTFFDLAVQQRGSANRVLETIAREVDFSPAEERVAATYSEGGRPACRVGVLLRVMILQHLYGLSDPQAEEQIKDRLSFQKFVQLDAHEAVPDETTICRFRRRLIACGLHEHVSKTFISN
jgi:transposase